MAGSLKYLPEAELTAKTVTLYQGTTNHGLILCQFSKEKFWTGKRIEAKALREYKHVSKACKLLKASGVKFPLLKRPAPVHQQYHPPPVPVASWAEDSSPGSSSTSETIYVVSAGRTVATGVA